MMTRNLDNNNNKRSSNYSPSSFTDSSYDNNQNNNQSPRNHNDNEDNNNNNNNNKNGNPDQWEDRMSKCRERNREHAKKTRLRKKMGLDGMKGKLLELQTEVCIYIYINHLLFFTILL